MNALFHPAVRAATASLCALVLTACGGGAEQAAALPSLDAQTTQAIQPDAAHEDVRRQALGTPLNADGPATTLTVRAHGRLAGNVGPLMQVWVDGVLIDSVEVKATEPTDYRFTVPALVMGRKVDVAFVEDAAAPSGDRDLFVTYVIAGNTHVAFNAPGVVYDRGKGAAAFDGIDVLPGQRSLLWYGALRFVWPAPNLTDHLTIRASGSLAGNVGPLLQLVVDGITVGSTEVRSSHFADYTFAVPPLSASSRVDVAYVNDGNVNGDVRSLSVLYLLARDTVLRSNAASVSYDLGSGAAAFDGVNVLPGQVTMTSNGALRSRWPAPNMTDRITVRASGSVAENVGPIMQVHVDGVVVGAVEVRAQTATDYSFATLPMMPGQSVDVAYTNDAAFVDAKRNLSVHYIIADRTVLLPTAPGVVYDIGSGAAAFDGINVLAGRVTLGSNGALRGAWPEPNMTQTVTVRARGQLAANVGPLMQLHVDGVVVGEREVRSAEFADYSFLAPAVRTGSQIDVVYVNDANINGQDRNLYVDYVVSGLTYVGATATSVRYDRGAGAAAFDGIDVMPGQRQMFWSGALRFSWPTPNITDTLTVRASGAMADGTGPIMQVRVDGVTVSSVEVRSPTATDHVLAVTPLRPGSKVDVVYVNDAVINGADRNLNVAYLMAGSTYLLPTAAGVVYDRGAGGAAFDGADVVPGQNHMGVNGALRASWPSPNVTERLTVRASASLAANTGAMMQVRVHGVIVGTVEVRSTSPADHVFTVPAMPAGTRIDVAFVNDANVNGEDRNLFIHYVDTGSSILLPTAPGVMLGTGSGEAAFEGDGTATDSGALFGNGALRFTVPSAAMDAATQAAQYAASRFLQQATFGPTLTEIQRVAGMPLGTWITEQLNHSATNDFVNYVQSQYDRGVEFRPGGSQYTTNWVGQRFWATAANSPDQLRKRVAFALHQIFMVSLVDSNLRLHSRAYAAYLDTLSRHAFGNFRTLLEEVALSPAMGIYLSHMRNRPEDLHTGRLPDENFAREVMQLFTIGLHELNNNGTPKLDAYGQIRETYNNDDVMALAKVFTGRAWAFPDDQLTEHNFRWGNPDYSPANDQRIDIKKMKAYPGQHSAAEKRLFAGKPHAVTIPAHSTAQDSVRIALDALFNHPNVGPFISRQLIQRMVTSHPSPAYVGRVAAKFNNNGAGVRGDMAAVVRAVLMDSEARNAPASDSAKVREPILRVTHWMRSFAAVSASGHYMMANDLGDLSQRALQSPSVFGYFRPGYVPPNTVFADSGTTLPELQIVNETTTAVWVNTALAMAGSGLGWVNGTKDVSSTLEPLVTLSTQGNIDGLIERINLLLLAGRMSPTLRMDLVEAITSVNGTNHATHQNRARVAVFLVLSSPEYLVQR